jgi:hypothetical protein
MEGGRAKFAGNLRASPFNNDLSNEIPQPEAVDMNGRIQMQGGKNWILPK